LNDEEAHLQDKRQERIERSPAATWGWPLAHLSLVSLVGAQRHAKDQSVDRDHVVLPDEAVGGLDALVDVPRTSRLAEFVNKYIAKAAQVRHELLRADPLNHLR
jgi:hypothetical protein